MKLFAKLLTAGFLTFSIAPSTIAAPQNEQFAGDAVPPNCQKKIVKQGTRETYRLCQSNGKPIEIEYEYFDKISTITTFSYRDGQLTKACENQLGSCMGFKNNQAAAAWIQGEEKVRVALTNPEDQATATDNFQRSQTALKLFKLADNRSVTPKVTKLQNIREYFLAIPDEFISHIPQKVRAQSIDATSTNLAACRSNNL